MHSQTRLEPGNLRSRVHCLNHYTTPAVQCDTKKHQEDKAAKVEETLFIFIWRHLSVETFEINHEMQVEI